MSDYKIEFDNEGLPERPCDKCQHRETDSFCQFNCPAFNKYWNACKGTKAEFMNE